MNAETLAARRAGALCGAVGVAVMTLVLALLRALAEIPSRRFWVTT